MTLSILLKNPSGQKVTVKKTISDVSPGDSNRVQTKLARKNSRHFSCIFTHLQKRGVLQQNRECHVSAGRRSPHVIITDVHYRESALDLAKVLPWQRDKQ